MEENDRIADLGGAERRRVMRLYLFIKKKQGKQKNQMKQRIRIHQKRPFLAAEPTQRNRSADFLREAVPSERTR